MNCLCASTRRTSRLLSRYYEACLRPVDLTPAQFELMQELRQSPRRSQAELAAALELDQTTLSRNLKLLIARQWVSMAPSEADRRKSSYALTREGEDTWERAVPRWRGAQEALRRTLGDDFEAALEMLTRVSASVPQQ